MVNLTSSRSSGLLPPSKRSWRKWRWAIGSRSSGLFLRKPWSEERDCKKLRGLSVNAAGGVRRDAAGFFSGGSTS